jgi:MerR HTH family regulatory protein
MSTCEGPFSEVYLRVAKDSRAAALSRSSSRATPAEPRAARSGSTAIKPQGCARVNETRMKTTTKSKPKQTRAPRATPGLPHQRVNALKVNGIGIKPDPELITAEELAYRWRVTQATLKYYVRRGLLKPVKLFSRRNVRFEFSEIRRIEAEAGVGHPAAAGGGTLK